MGSLNKDTGAALLLLATTAAFCWETFNIPDLGYASMGSQVWPRVILVLLAVGLVWSLFTFVLRVYLPEDELLKVY